MSWLKLKQGNWFVSINICLALCLLGSLLSCTSTKQIVDPSVYDNIHIEHEDSEGFMWIDWTKPDINHEPVKLNWKLTLDESSDYRSYKYFDNHFWLLDQQGSLFHIDVPTGEIEYYTTEESWVFILTHDENNLLMAKETSNDTSEIQLYQPKKRKVAWTKSLEQPTKFYLGRVIVNGILYIGSASDTSFGSTLFAVRVKDGSELWRFNVQEEINSDLFVSDNRLFFTCKDSSCYALDQSNGKLLWRIHQDIYWRQDYTGPIKRFVSTNGILGYFGGTYQPLRLVEEETGTILWEYPYPATDIEPYIKPF